MSYSVLIHAYKLKYGREAKWHRFKSGMLINVSNLTHTSCIQRDERNDNQLGAKVLPRCNQTQMLSSNAKTKAYYSVNQTVNQVHACQLATPLINLLNVLQLLITYVSDLGREGSNKEYKIKYCFICALCIHSNK